VDISLEVEGWRADAQSQRMPGLEAALERIRVNGVQAQIDRFYEFKRTKTAAEFENFLHGGDLLTRSLLATGRIDDAVKLSRAITELFPQATRAHIVHGLAREMSGDTRSAAQEYAKAKQVFRAPQVDPNEKFPQDDETWFYLDQLA